jgi:hypothetical protein
MYSSFLNWLSRYEWSVLLEVAAAKGIPPKEINRRLREFLREMEETDGTLDFRWVQFGFRDRQDPREFYLLVGGLSSTESWHWSRRWRDINQHGDDAGAGIAYVKGGRERLRAALREHLGERKFDVRMQIGPKQIQRRRRLRPADIKQLREDGW